VRSARPCVVCCCCQDTGLSGPELKAARSRARAASVSCHGMACRELPVLRAQIKQMEGEKERLGDKVDKAAAQAAGARAWERHWQRAEPCRHARAQPQVLHPTVPQCWRACACNLPWAGRPARRGKLPGRVRRAAAGSRSGGVHQPAAHGASVGGGTASGIGSS
jgi:hypothetical protein